MQTTPLNYTRILVAGNIFAALRPFVEQHNLGRVLPGGLFYVLWKASAGVNTAQVPDVSFLRTEHLTMPDPTMPYPGAPDFAVEGVTITEADFVAVEKVRDYLAAGTEEVWLAYVGLQEVHQYRRDEPKIVRVYSGDDLITSKVFPGLSLKTSDLFKI